MQVKEKDKQTYSSGPALFITVNSVKVSQMCFYYLKNSMEILCFLQYVNLVVNYDYKL